jgi:poly(A) polymerase
MSQSASSAAVRWPRITGDWLTSPELAKVFSALGRDGAEARVIGGAVRNALINRPVTEIDIATTALPDDVMQLARDAGLGAHPTGIAHGTVTVVADGRSFEVTTLRRDVETDGRHAIVRFTSSWEDDAARRDFTINALSCTLDGTIFDYTGGLADLRRRRVRFIGDPQARIREDFLRILRFFRFAAEYGNGDLDHQGLAASEALKSGLGQLSAERIQAELLKLLPAPHAIPVIGVMATSGILASVLTGPLFPARFTSLCAIEAALGEPPDALTRLAALAIAEPADAAALAGKLKLSNADTARLMRATASGLSPDPAMAGPAARQALYRLGPEDYARSVRLAWATADAPPSDARWRTLALLPDRWRVPRLPATGADVLALGVTAGPKVGAVLSAFERWWLDSDFPADDHRNHEMLKALAREALA